MQSNSEIKFYPDVLNAIEIDLNNRLKLVQDAIVACEKLKPITKKNDTDFDLRWRLRLFQENQFRIIGERLKGCTKPLLNPKMLTTEYYIAEHEKDRDRNFEKSWKLVNFVQVFESKINQL